MSEQMVLRLLVLGAHPDDAEFHAGGLISVYRSLGHQVRIVSVTDGGAGHQSLPREELVATRRREGQAVAALIGVEYSVWDFPDGRLLPTLDVRERIIREIRSFAPDLVLTHRTNDYHPDHRAVGQAVQDASYLVTVPKIAPDAPALRRDPVVAYMNDHFTRPNPFRADLVLDLGPWLDRLVSMLSCHASQFFDWLPYNLGLTDQLPSDADGRRTWLQAWFADRARAMAAQFRHDPHFAAILGGAAVEFAEGYEISEYAGRLDGPRAQRLFPQCWSHLFSLSAEGTDGHADS